MEIREHECMDGEQKVDTWSNLPPLLIWMIKARLDVPHNLRLAAVCKSWQHASSNYPMQREFISCSTGEKYTIDHPDFCKTRTLSSKQGWLVLARKALYCKDSQGADSDPPFFLFNPFLKKRIMLPYMGTFDINPRDFYLRRFNPTLGAFTIVDGNPHRVVLLMYSCGTILLWIAQPGDDKWTMHSYECRKPDRFYRIVHVLIVKQLVYCINEHSRVVVFSMVDLQWTDTMEKADRIWKSNYYITESEGELIEMHLDESQCATASYRLNTTNADREPLKDEDTSGWSWFYRRPGKSCFLSKGNKRKTVERVCENMEKYYPVVMNAREKRGNFYPPSGDDVCMELVDMV